MWDRICRSHDRAVIAAPGGVVADAVLYDRVLASAHSIWLRATPEDHMSRVMAQGDFRPMTSNRGAMDDLKAILAARGAEYARADAQVDTSPLGLDECLTQLVAHVDALLAAGRVGAAR
jgi:XRE family aerobic/anaerobic benzoate catabolism transcriptional regulator